MSALAGRVVVITGAAGGLGTALARAFAREGCGLFLTDVRADSLDRLVCELARGGAQVTGNAVDLATAAGARSMIDAAVGAFGGIHVLVNNAAVSTSRSFWDLQEEDWDAVLQVNVKGLFFALQAAARHMTESGGSIINIASVAGRAGRPALLHYAASKAAVISITRSAALALAKSKVRVNAIEPGMIDTEMLHDLQANWAQSSNGNGAAAPSENLVPMGRIAQPEEIAAAALFLAGEGAGYITGQTLNVCGGIVMS